jgi:hypothetical protein
MTPEMVVLSWGRPQKIDDREVLANGTRKERWIYGQKGKSANYVYFKNGLVERIKA